MLQQDPPWKVIRAFGPLVHIHNVSGGVLAGDRLSLDVEVAAGAHGQITTTGATRLYRHRPGAEDSEQRSNFKVADGATLEYLPDPLIPFAGSRHSQRTSFALGRDATLFWWEVLASTFAFDRLRISTAIDICERPALREDYQIEPARRSLHNAARMSHATHLSSFNVLKEGKTSAFWRDMEQELRKNAPSHWGITTLAAGGVVARALSLTGRHLQSELATLRNTASMMLTGKPAPLPRKVY